MANREVGISSVVELGEILRAVRKESGLTQRDAAALCNVSLPFLNGLEQGKADSPDRKSTVRLQPVRY